MNLTKIFSAGVGEVVDSVAKGLWDEKIMLKLGKGMYYGLVK